MLRGLLVYRMPQSLSQTIIHLIFSTKDREPFLDETIKESMHAYLATMARDRGWECYRVGGVADHVHLALRQPRTDNQSDLIGHIKRNSSKWIQQQGKGYASFAWQRGYGAFSVGYSQLPALVEYIRKQEEHHRSRTFQEEYRDLLEKTGMDFDEKYVWD
jgi:putative transposase